MASAVATTSTQGPTTVPLNGSSVECSNFPLLDQLKAKFNIDGVDIDGTKSLMELAEIEDDDLPPFSFDFEDIWDRVSAEINIEDDFSEVLQQITDSYTDVSVGPMKFKLKHEDIIDGISEETLKLPPLDDLRDLLGNLTPARKTDEGSSCVPTDGPAPKKIKGDKLTVEPRKKSHEADTQYVFVNEVATNQKKVITLKKGAKLPKGFEIASIQGDLPPLPGELSSITADALKNAILCVTNTSPPPTKTAPSPVTKPVPPTPPPIVRSASPKKPEVNKLNSLSELMTAEMERKEKSQNQQKHRLVYKQRNSNPSKVVSLINKAATVGLQRSEQRMDVDIEPVRKESEPSSLRTVGQITDTIRIVVPTEPSMDLESTTVSISPEEYSANNVNKNKSCFFACNMCDRTFFCYNDNLFRIHLLLKHNLEFSDDAYFETSKVYTNSVRRCVKCKLTVLNQFDEHRKKCLPMLSMEAAFKEECLADHLEKMACGICPAEFDIRYQLKSHMEEKHPNVGRIMIFEPQFRCSRCLKRFDESVTLAKHCAKCRETCPRPETLMELAKSLLYCDDCETKHPTIETTLACYMGLDIRRCLLCMAVFKNKALYFKHLRMYHGVLFNPKLRVPCPACEDLVFTTIGMMTQHWVTDHLVPTLTQVNQDLSITPVTSGAPKNLVADKQQKGAKTVTKKLPDLQPIFPNQKPVNTNVPPGIVINTSRINQVRPTATATPNQAKALYSLSKLQDGKMVLVPRPGGNAPLPNRPGRPTSVLRRSKLADKLPLPPLTLTQVNRTGSPKQYSRPRAIVPNQTRQTGPNINIVRTTPPSQVGPNQVVRMDVPNQARSTQNVRIIPPSQVAPNTSFRMTAPNQAGSTQTVRMTAPNQAGATQTFRMVAPSQAGATQTVRTVAPNQAGPNQGVRIVVPNQSNEGVKTITLKQVQSPTSTQPIRQSGLNIAVSANQIVGTIGGAQIRNVGSSGSQIIRLITTSSGVRAIAPNQVLGGVGSPQIVRTISSNQVRAVNTGQTLRTIVPTLPRSGSPNTAVRSANPTQTLRSVTPNQVATSSVIRTACPNQLVRTANANQSGTVGGGQFVRAGGQPLHPDPSIVRGIAPNHVVRTIGSNQLVRLVNPSGKVINAVLATSKPSTGTPASAGPSRTSSGSATTESVVNTESSPKTSRTIVIGGKTFQFELLEPKQVGSAQNINPGNSTSQSKSKPKD